MFTGVVQGIGTIQQILRQGQTIQLTCQAEVKLLAELKIGDSVCVNGVCLTVIERSNRQFTVEMMPETFQRTNLRHLQSGSKVNLERALAMNQRFEGHIVQGHVDTTVRLIGQKRQQNALILTFALPSAYCKEVVTKGSVALNGTSLTVIRASTHDFQIGLIPHSQAQTNLRQLHIGDLVNLETDILGKYMQRQLELAQY